MIFDIPLLVVSIPPDIYVTFLDATGKTLRKSLQYEDPSYFNKQLQHKKLKLL